MHWNPLEDASPCLADAVVAIGVFDGMHIGHRALFEMARQRARELGVCLWAVTFDRDPDEIFRAEDARFGKLLSNEQRLQMIAQQTDGGILSLPASLEVFGIEPMPFLDYLACALNPRAIFTGSDFHFGSRASGSVRDIERWASGRDCACVACDLIEDGGKPVSATRIRSLLERGDVSEAKRLLAGRAHGVVGRVVHGRGQGSEFGFATANLDLAGNEAVLPREGVYGAYAVVDGKRYAAAVNVGVSKTFSNAIAPLEAHLLDYQGDLYGRQIAIEFEQWLREPRVFETTEELVATVMDNIEWVRMHLGAEADGANS